MSKPYTPEEIRDRFLTEVKNRADYWARVGTSKEDAVDGIVFSILSVLDGSAGMMPAFHIAPVGRKEDKAFFEEQGEDHFPLNEDLDIPGEFGHLGPLHERWVQRKKQP